MHLYTRRALLLEFDDVTSFECLDESKPFLCFDRQLCRCTDDLDLGVCKERAEAAEQALHDLECSTSEKTGAKPGEHREWDEHVEEKGIGLVANIVRQRAEEHPAQAEQPVY